MDAPPVGKIYSLIPKIMAEIGPIGKNQTNTFQKYKFRGIDDFYLAIQPALIKHGVFCVPQVIKSESAHLEGKEGKFSYRVLLTVSHRFICEDRSYIEVVTQGEGIDSSDKATNKAMSAAMKYCFIELFSIPTEESDDADRDSPAIGAVVKPHASNSTGLKTRTREYLSELMLKHGWKAEQVKLYMIKRWGYETSSDLKDESYNHLLEVISSTTFQGACADLYVPKRPPLPGASS